MTVAASSPVLALLALVLALITLSDRSNGDEGPSATNDGGQESGETSRKSGGQNGQKKKR